MIPVILYLFILLIYYGSDYVILDWSQKNIQLYRDINHIFNTHPCITRPECGGGSIWRNVPNDPYIKQLCITESSLQLQMHLALFAGYGGINVSESSYGSRVCRLLSLSPEGLCTYDPLSRSLYVKNVCGSVYELLDLARNCARITEAFPCCEPMSNPRVELQEYYKKYFRTPDQMVM